MDSTISGVFPNIASDKRIYIQGNHESWAGLEVDGTNLMNETGYYETDYYGVYAFNHDDFPWDYSSVSDREGPYPVQQEGYIDEIRFGNV